MYTIQRRLLFCKASPERNCNCGIYIIERPPSSRDVKLTIGFQEIDNTKFEDENKKEYHNHVLEQRDQITQELKQRSYQSMKRLQKI